MPEAKELLHSNLHEVFSERDPERRRAAIERTYTDGRVSVVRTLITGIRARGPRLNSNSLSRTVRGDSLRHASLHRPPLLPGDRA